jgi:transposase-like protein
MPRQPDLELARLWADRLRRHQRSALTVVQFCQREDISTAAFYQWRRRLAERDTETSAPVATPLFVPLRLPTISSAVQIELPNGAMVRLPHDADARLVCQLVQLAGSLGAASQEDRPC